MNVIQFEQNPEYAGQMVTWPNGQFEGQNSIRNKTKNRQNINAVTFCGNLILLTI